ncbi:Wzz/FepE/Etk N-terminal domain-containing protein [bacterium]|nr:Wzz/FepE/Etk N-terminal domain-containing protein [bacterium]
MPANQPSEPVRRQTDISEDEIELIDLLRVIWKWKYLIFGGTIVCALVAAIISFILPKIYSVDTIIEPGILGIVSEGENQGHRVYIDSPENIKALIDVGSFENAILAHLGKQAKNIDLLKEITFKTSIPKDSKALKVSYETANVELGKQILNNLNELLLKKYSKFIQYYRKESYSKINQKEATLSKISASIFKVENDISTAQTKIDTNVKIKSNRIATIKSGIEAKKIQIVNSQEWIKDVQIEIVRITRNTDFLIEERNKLLASKQEGNNNLSSVIYINTIQQNIAYSNNLKNQISNANNQIVRDQADIERLENEIRDLDVQKENLIKQTKYQISTLQSQIDNLGSQKKFTSEEIEILNYKKDNVQNLQILKLPTSSPDPIAPKKKLIVILATFIGIFMMVFLSFLLEYFSKNKIQKLSVG